MLAWTVRQGSRHLYLLYAVQCAIEEAHKKVLEGMGYRKQCMLAWEAFRVLHMKGNKVVDFLLEHDELLVQVAPRPTDEELCALMWQR